MIRPLIGLMNLQIRIVALMFTDSGHLRTALVVTPFRAARRLRLSAAMRSCSVRLCVLRGRLVRLQQGQFGIRCQILSVRFCTDGPSTIPRKP